jgi:hypothetical protein
MAGNQQVTVWGDNFAPYNSRVWVGGYLAPTFVQSSYTSITILTPRIPTTMANRWLTVQVESNSVNATQAPSLIYYGVLTPTPSPSSGGNSSSTKWGMTIDELVVVIVVVVVLLSVLLSVQLLWCLSRFMGVRFACVDRCCPRLVAAHKRRQAAEREEEHNGINLSLLHNDQLHFDHHHQQPHQPHQAAAAAPARPSPYTPAAAHFAAPSPAAPHPAAYQAYHLPPPASIYSPAAMEGVPGGGQLDPSSLPLPLPPAPVVLYPRSLVPSPRFYQ